MRTNRLLSCLLVALVGAPSAAQTLISNGNAPAGQPPGSDFVQASSLMFHSVALRADGTLAVWGGNTWGQCNQPPLPAGLAYTKCAAGRDHTAALRSDGAVIAFGRNDRGQCIPPTLPSGVIWTDVDAGDDWTVGVASDGGVRLWGSNPAGPLHPAPWQTDFVAVCAGYNHVLALRSNGTIVAWGGNYDGQIWVPPLPPGMTYTQLVAGTTFSGALRSDGQVVLWGAVAYMTLPPLGSGQRWVKVEAGLYQVIAWRSDGTVHVTGLYWYWLTPPPANQDYVGVAWAHDHVHWLAAPHVAASYTTLGPGCPGSSGASHLTAAHPPTLGSTFTCHVDHVPEGFAILLSGLDAASSPLGPLPIDLSFLGMTGCIGRVRTDVVEVAVATGGVAAFALNIPWSQRLIGASFYQQALLPDAAANPAGLVLSDAQAAVIGLY